MPAPTRSAHARTSVSSYDVFVTDRTFFFSPLPRLPLAISLLAFPALAKDAPLAVIDWPATGTPVVRSTFGKLKQLDGMSNMRGYVMDTMAQNLSPRLTPSATFSVNLFDKNKVRVGEDVIALNNVGSGEAVRFQTAVMASGVPVLVSVQDSAQIPKTITLTVNSTPQGAMLKLDGDEADTNCGVLFNYAPGGDNSSQNFA